MFESQPANDPASQRLTRRAFLFTSIAAAAGVGLLTIRRPHRAFAEDPTSHRGEPVVVVPRLVVLPGGVSEGPEERLQAGQLAGEEGR